MARTPPDAPPDPVGLADLAADQAADQAADRGAILAAELLRHRLDLHVRTAVTSVSATGTAATVLVFMLWGHLPASTLLGWWPILVAVLALRLSLGAWQRRHPPADDAARRRWLSIHRASFALHGCVWFGLAWLVAGNTNYWVMETTAFIMAALVGGALVTASFDTRAAWLFAAPVAAGLFSRLFQHTDNQGLGLAVVSLMFIAIMAMAARRGAQQSVAAIEAGVDERTRFQEAQRYAQDAEQARQALAAQNDLMQELIRETRQGFWFIDPQGRTLDVNPAMCTLLGRTREQMLQINARDVFTGPERATIEHQLERRRQGHTDGYEIDFQRPDGTRRHAYNQATPIHDRHGRRLGSIGLWTDLTAQRAQALELRTYERVTNSISDMVCVVGADRRLLLVNDAWCERSGWPRAQALGTDVDEACQGADDTPWREALDACLRDGRVSTVVQALHLPGSAPPDAGMARREAVTLQTSFYPYRDSDTPTRSVILVSRDITAEETSLALVTQREAEQRAMLSAFPGYIAVRDEQYRYVFINARAAELHGLSSDQIIGRTMAEVVGNERFMHHLVPLQRAAAGEIVRVDDTYASKNGQPAIDLEFTHVAGPPPARGPRLFYSFGVDITERRRTQEALALARDEAERANLAKSRFLSHMSHELRTPMNAIVGFAQLLRRDARPPLPPHQLGYAKQILRGAQHLLELINEILDLSRIEADRLPLSLEVVPLTDLAADGLAFVGQLASERQVQLRPSIGLPAQRGSVRPAAWADARRLRQVLLNLLGNAIKYNRPGGHVQLVCVDEGATVRLEVHDSGRGIREADRPRMFTPFERLQHDRGATEGAGIGLALSKRLIEAMGGQIGFTSVPGEGSCFWVRVPSVPDSETDGNARVAVDSVLAPLTEGYAPAPPGPAVTVLYIDDNEVNLLLVETLLTEIRGLRVLATPSPEEGLRLARSERPRLVLLDIHMPVLDGFAVLKRLQADAETADIPVVAVTADAQPAEMEAAQAAGFSSYLTKPLDLDRLLSTVRRFCLAG